MAEIYHMVTAAHWEAARRGSMLEPDSLATEGFIHCTAGERNLLEVAETHYRDEPGEWLVLVLDPLKIGAEVSWEVQPNGLAYPHVYGPLNLDAVTEVRPFPRDSAGRFLPFR
ncbi:MAG: DUF952 domain-containing protein [Anaerolineaceae bacterium]